MSLRAYGTVFSTFWIGPTGREMRRLGRDVQLVALYLVTGPHATMIGLYYVPLVILCHEVGIEADAATAAFDALSRIGFAYYDSVTEHVWVPNMARFQIGASLKAKDKRVDGIVNQLKTLRGSPFLQAFLDLYAEPFRLAEAKGWRELVESLGSPPEEGPSKTLPTRFEGPPKEPRRDIPQEQEQEQNQDQDSDQEKKQKQTQEKEEKIAPPAAAPSPSASRPPASKETTETAGAGVDTTETALAPLTVVVEPQELMCAWNTHAPNLVPCHGMTKTRVKLARQRLAERPALTDWVTIFERMNRSPFLRGENDWRWKASLDWLLESPDHVLKVAEGKYDHHESPSASERQRIQDRIEAVRREYLVQKKPLTLQEEIEAAKGHYQEWEKQFRQEKKPQ